MKTRASIMGHPVHMGLAHFPVALLIGAFAFDAGAKALGIGELVVVAAYLSLGRRRYGRAGGSTRAGRLSDQRTAACEREGNATLGGERAGAAHLHGCLVHARWDCRERRSDSPDLGAFGALLISVSGFLGGSLVLGVHVQADTMPR
jgi:uncharacterized membrane protein